MQSMSHTHCNHHHPVSPTKALYISIIIAFIFMIVEVVGGYLSHSLALISDALHMLTDVGALTLSLVVAYIVKWPATSKMSFGYHRAEPIGALISAISLWALSGVLIYESIQHMLYPQPVQGWLMFIFAIIGLIANIAMMRVLHPAQGDNLNMRAAYIHVLGDLLSSIGIILSGALIWFTNWNWIDPLITLMTTGIILYTSGRIILDSIQILMESAPSQPIAADVLTALQSLQGVKEVHDLHIWSLSSEETLLSAHLIADEPDLVLQHAHQTIIEKFKIQNITLQIETAPQFKSKYCDACKSEVF
jgi:cobalt-zinc-cadmium efflux system protein